MSDPLHKTDRYVTYQGIDCVGNSKRLMAMLRHHIDDPAKTNLFWEKFKAKLDAIDNPLPGQSCQDELFLIHSYINNLEEFFEEQEDHEALKLLKRIEEECC